MKKLLFTLYSAAIVACSIPIAMNAAAISREEQEDIFVRLIELSARQLELAGIIELYEGKLPNGIDPKRIINNAHAELRENDTQINSLKLRLEQAGLSSDVIEHVIEEMLFGQQIPTD